MTTKPKLPCITCGARPKTFGKNKCIWCWLKAQPIEDQVRAADRRRKEARAATGYVERPRVPEAEWPAGTRWCSDCQGYIPLDYARGAKCIAHASKAAHASHIKRTYDLSREEWEALYEWQGRRCYVCGNRDRSQRLAVDHDHTTQLVRGLLCANDEWGCNHALVGLLERAGADPLAVARRLVEYLEKTPIDRMRDGEPTPYPRITRQQQFERSVLGIVPGNPRPDWWPKQT